MAIWWLEQAASDVPSADQWLSANEKVRLAGMHVSKRRADWRLGRWTAKLAVAAYLNLPTDPNAIRNTEIRAASSGAPEVFIENEPVPFAISLSHSSGTALCAISQSDATFGCDVETIAPHSEAFVADYFTIDEKAIIATISAENLPGLLTLLWSAKESALKALRVGLTIDTRSVSVQLNGDWQTIWQNKSLTGSHFASPVSELEMWHPLSVCYSGNKLFRGWWNSGRQVVRTVVHDAADRSADTGLHSLQFDRNEKGAILHSFKHI